MGRATANLTITDNSRDNGKVFVLTEMPASQAEAWAARAILALIQGGVQLPEGFESLGMAGMAELGIKALTGLKWELAQPLMEEMFECVQIMPDPLKPSVVRRLIEQDIEEVATRVRLRAEIWKLHAGFLKAGALLPSKG